MSKRLQVIDGADKGQSFLLPEAGAVLIGNSRKHTDICLHDLFVARVHCQVEVEGDKVTVTDRITPNGILVNGAKVPQRDLLPGDVIRVGNSYLRLEEEASDSTAEMTADTIAEATPLAPEPGKLPHLPLERLAELTNHTLAHFKVGAPIARGHGGVIFRARDLNTDETVVLKVLSPEFPANGDEMQRFARALKPRLALRHANLVTLCGAGKSGPYVWIATELIEGDSLVPAIDRQRTARKAPWKPALHVAKGIACALEYLKQNHQVHGNITPANVLHAAEDGPAQLNDLALWHGLAGSELRQQTLEQKLLAESPYLSPEHLDPDATVDDLSDQYCLGAVVYALLTGRPPFEGASPEETMERVRTVMPVKPKEYQPAMPDGFQAIVLQMLAKHPEERYPSPASLLADLDRVGA
jgi:hypothetical protein